MTQSLCYNAKLRWYDRRYHRREETGLLEELMTAPFVVGAKQTRRALAAGQVKKLFLAQDADPALTAPLADLAAAGGVPVEEGATMAQLGAACKIAVGAACCATLVSILTE